MLIAAFQLESYRSTLASLLDLVFLKSLSGFIPWQLSQRLEVPEHKVLVVLLLREGGGREKHISEKILLSHACSK